MKQSQNSDDFFKHYQDIISKENSKSHHDSRDSNNLDIGSQFEEFLQSRNGRSNNQCENG
jgi:hypothetical protein